MSAAKCEKHRYRLVRTSQLGHVSNGSFKIENTCITNSPSLKDDIKSQCRKRSEVSSQLLLLPHPAHIGSVIFREAVVVASRRSQMAVVILVRQLVRFDHLPSSRLESGLDHMFAVMIGHVQGGGLSRWTLHHSCCHVRRGGGLKIRREGWCSLGQGPGP